MPDQNLNEERFILSDGVYSDSALYIAYFLIAVPARTFMKKNSF
jgi:hypothetical protein